MEYNLDIKIKPLTSCIAHPKYMTKGAGAIDLMAAVNSTTILYAKSSAIISTGISIEICDPRIVGLILPRSGLSTKHGINLQNNIGLIDNDYHQEILVALENRSDVNYIIRPGSRIAQMIFIPFIQANIQIANSIKQNNRGGFGSTGVSN